MDDLTVQLVAYDAVWTAVRGVSLSDDHVTALWQLHDREDG